MTFNMGEKNFILGVLAMMISINAVEKTVLAFECANSGEICDLRQQRPCCDDNFKCKWFDSVTRYQCTELAKLGDGCFYNDDCIGISHSTCSPMKECVCRHNNVQVNNTCMPLLNEFCWKESCAPNNSMCVDNECQCNSNFLAQSNDQCLPMLLGLPCNDDATCKPIKYAKCSMEKICVCSENTIETSPIRCSLLLGEFCKTDKECGVTNSKCIDNTCQCELKYFLHSNRECKPAYLGMPCEDSSYCERRITNSICAKNMCACNLGYVLSEGNLCSVRFDSHCVSDTDCLKVNTVCIDNKCQCKRNYLLSETGCLPKYLGGSCQETSDCSNLEFAICSKGKCVCKDRFFRVNRTSCTRELNEICTNNEDCRVENSHCFQNHCQCDEGYIQDSPRNCLTTNLQGYCFNDADCKLITNARCSWDNQCVCNENHVKISNMSCELLSNENCTIKNQCAMKNSICIDNKCQCDNGYVQVANNKCVRKYLEKYCFTDNDCTDIRYAKCFNAYKCICKSNYKQLGLLQCSPLLGSYCRQNKDCVTVNSMCFENECQCLNGYSQHSYNLCVPILLGQACQSDKDCTKILNGRCSEANTCVCKHNYSKFDKTVCLPLIGEFCQENKDCKVYNSNCAENKCQCLENYIPLTNTECLSQYLNTDCYSTNDCNKLINSHCSRMNRCVCNEKFISIGDEKCSPILGGRCSEFNSCSIANSHCIDYKCQCKPNFVSGIYNDCLPTRLDGFCESDSDCLKIRFSKCIENKCMCRNNYEPFNNTQCLPLLNSFCETSQECLVENSTCIDNKCQCKTGFMVHLSHKCEPISLGDTCKTDMDCMQIQKGKCSSDKVCVCDSNTFALDRLTCAPFLNSFCQFDECKIELSHCIENKCQCMPDYSAISAIQCIKTRSLYSCWDDSHCLEPWHFECSKDKKCICKLNNMAISNSTCLPLLGGYCWRQDQCVTMNSECIDFHCRCKSGFMPVSNNLCV